MEATLAFDRPPQGRQGWVTFVEPGAADGRPLHTLKVPICFPQGPES
ncbi:hypothetical protein [Thermaerobacter marianensis]|nr:hypothetical protein [Thermaerobacter marianensis]